MHSGSKGTRDDRGVITYWNGRRMSTSAAVESNKTVVVVVVVAVLQLEETKESPS